MNQNKTLLVAGVVGFALLVGLLFFIFGTGDGFGDSEIVEKLSPESAKAKAALVDIKREVTDARSTLENLKAEAKAWKQKHVIRMDYRGTPNVQFETLTIKEVAVLEEKFKAYEQFILAEAKKNAPTMPDVEFMKELRNRIGEISAGIDQYARTKEALKWLAEEERKKEKAAAKKARNEEKAAAIKAAAASKLESRLESAKSLASGNLDQKREALDLAVDVLQQSNAADLIDLATEVIDLAACKEILLEWLPARIEQIIKDDFGDNYEFQAFARLLLAEAYLRAGETKKYKHQIDLVVAAVKKVDGTDGGELFTRSCLNLAMELARTNFGKDNRLDVEKEVSRFLDLAETSSFLSRKESNFQVIRMAGLARRYSDDERWNRCEKRWYSFSRSRNHFRTYSGARALAIGGDYKLAWKGYGQKNVFSDAEICLHAAYTGDEDIYRGAKQMALVSRNEGVVAYVVRAQSLMGISEPEEFDTAIPRAHSIQNKQHRGAALNWIAIAFAERGEIDKALEHHSYLGGRNYYEIAAFEIAASSAQNKTEMKPSKLFSWIFEMDGHNYYKIGGLAGAYLGYRGEVK